MRLPTAASAPGKVILFGEHAVVYGRPAIAVAIALRARALLVPSDRLRVCGRERGGSAYVWAALRRLWDGPAVDLKIASDIPSASGMGSSAAVSVSSVASILLSRSEFSMERVAREAFEVEFGVQGRASPTDTSTSTAGGAVVISPRWEGERLWEIRKGKKRWRISRVQIPEIPLIVVLSGRRSDTGKMVARVARALERDPSLWSVIDSIEDLVRVAIEPLRRGDLESLGELMTENQRLLRELGVSHPVLERIIEALEPHVYGAKLTGAGGGGSIIAIPRDRKKAVDAALRAGFRVVSTSMSPTGVRQERV